MHTTGQTRPARTFWWERAQPIDADVAPLRAVIFDADALAERDGDIAPRAGLIDLVMSLFAAGIWVGVVSTRRRAWAEPLVRQLLGDGLVETIVTVDDMPEPGRGVELYRLALWELGITREGALAFESSDRGFSAAVAAGLPTLVVTNGYTDDQESAAGCRQLHRRWWIQRKRAEAA